ncbi:FAD-dependent oxidoreductase [Acaryochloris sp. IP29b_bin.137]|uniref:FAD-dependent oxidoreductase n=1 Tax=Acaryochloris sp. IP29b_bin.137 TaxID=2969217 RepID=UPI00261416AC|nr:FAD-dependent oxidoreductase [Acaryochloris sp. IP29b_bin.137]
MAVDYDLVVVGNNTAARFAAIAAKERSARVAFISVAPEVIPHHLFLNQWSQTRPHQCSLKAWAEARTMTWQAPHSPAQLANLGIEQINGAVQFRKEPQLQVHVQDRVLRSRRYLLCLDADQCPPTIPGVQTEDWIFPANIIEYLDNLAPSLSHPILVVGGGPISTILCQAIARLGYPVTLLCEHPHILPWEDPEAAARIQAHLEADGVQIFSRCQIKEVIPKSQSFYQVVTNYGELTVDRLVWAAEPLSSAIHPSRMDVELQHRSQGLWVNPQLQTSSSQIYACGSVLGGYTLADITHHEALVAVRNVLSKRQTTVDYRLVPWSIQTAPALARVGLTEQQAQQQQLSFRVVYPSLLNTPTGRLQNLTAGWSKLIVQADGQILGAHVIGPTAAEIIYGVTIAIQQRCPISKLADGAAFSSSYSSIIGQVACQWSNR